MASRPKIGVDLDGCVFDFDIGMRRYLQARFGWVSLDESDDWMNATKIGVTQAGWNEMWGPGIRELFASLPAYPGAVDALKRIQGVMDLVVITHRPVRVADITLLQLAHAGLKPRAVHHVSGSDKSTVDEDVVAYVEDRVENVRDIAHRYPCFVPRRGWNRELHDGGGSANIWPFDSWKEIAKWATRRTR